jgi:hypothetical protein
MEANQAIVVACQQLMHDLISHNKEEGEEIQQHFMMSV